MDEIASARAPDRVDGRTARSERTRRAIVDALLALHRERVLSPTGERVARRAGVSTRALWTHFNGMEALWAAAGQRLIELQRAEHTPVSTQLPLPRRVEAFCRQRARMLEILAPSARSAQLREPFFPQLQRNKDIEYRRAMKEIDILFAHELDAAGPGRDELRHALLAATTMPSWFVLRDQLKLDTDAACGVMLRTVTALLAAALANSGAR